VRFRAIEVAQAVNGDVVGSDVEIEGVAIDSRAVTGGELFVPIVADRDGHEFVVHAVEAGAVAHLAQRGRRGHPDLDVEGTAILVEDTGRALLALGRHARSRLGELDAHVIGITGSVGKTTVKDLTKAALGATYVVHASPRSFNNELGVPVTLATAPDDVEAVVVEMGARGRGHIRDLCAIARPDVGIVTTVALAHAEMFGSIEEVAAAKSELVQGLPASGTAILNADHPLVIDMATRTDARVVTFGQDPAAGKGQVDVTASAVVLDDELRPSFHLHSPWGGAEVRLPVRGAHQVMNALAAAAAAMACGASPAEVADGLQTAVLSPWRMELQRTPSGGIVLNDAYNANPTSMEAALRSLAALPRRENGRRVAVVGVMAELGPDGPVAHRRMAQLASDLGIELIAVDAPEYGDLDAEQVHGVDGALKALGPLGDGDAVLVKGSRVAGLEAVADALLR
jgi:UDP-N-acetylmuramoyl-tripeptide--D-alanyl-D-alanine ligase